MQSNEQSPLPPSLDSFQRGAYDLWQSEVPKIVGLAMSQPNGSLGLWLVVALARRVIPRAYTSPIIVQVNLPTAYVKAIRLVWYAPKIFGQSGRYKERTQS